MYEHLLFEIALASSGRQSYTREEGSGLTAFLCYTMLELSKCKKLWNYIKCRILCDQLCSPEVFNYERRKPTGLARHIIMNWVLDLHATVRHLFCLLRTCVGLIVTTSLCLSGSWGCRLSMIGPCSTARADTHTTTTPKTIVLTFISCRPNDNFK